MDRKETILLLSAGIVAIFAFIFLLICCWLNKKCMKKSSHSYMVTSNPSNPNNGVPRRDPNQYYRPDFPGEVDKKPIDRERLFNSNYVTPSSSGSTGFKRTLISATQPSLTYEIDKHFKPHTEISVTKEQPLDSQKGVSHYVPVTQPDLVPKSNIQYDVQNFPHKATPKPNLASPVLFFPNYSTNILKSRQLDNVAAKMDNLKSISDYEPAYKVTKPAHKKVLDQNKVTKRKRRTKPRKYPQYIEGDVVKNVAEWPNYSNQNYVYHYTSKISGRHILKEKEIKVNQARIPRFGTGVFLTDLDPTLSTHELLENNYNGNYKYLIKTQCAFALPRNHLKLVKLYDPLHASRSVYRSDQPILLENLKFYLVLRN